MVFAQHTTFESLAENEFNLASTSKRSASDISEEIDARLKQLESIVFYISFFIYL